MSSKTNPPADIQQVLQSFMNQVPDTPGQTKKVRLQTTNPETGQLMTVEMEQSSAPVIAGTNQIQTSAAMVPASNSVLAQAVPGVALLEGLIGGHISYLIIPFAGLVVAWSYNSIGGGVGVLVTAMNFFLLSIVLELMAKFMTFPAVETDLDKRLEKPRAYLAARTWVGQWYGDYVRRLKSRHIKLTLQWTGIAFAFMGCLVMFGYFLQKMSELGGVSTSVQPYAVQSGGGAFEVR